MTKPDYQYDDLPIMTWADIQNSDNAFYTFHEALVRHPLIKQMGFAETNANFECCIDEYDREIAKAVLENQNSDKPLQFLLNKIPNKKEFANNDYGGRFDLDLHNDDLSVAFRISIVVGHPETPKVGGRNCFISTEFVHLEDNQRNVTFIAEETVEFEQNDENEMLQPVLDTLTEHLPSMFNDMKYQIESCQELHEKLDYNKKALRKIQKWADEVEERVHNACKNQPKHEPTLEQEQLQAQTELAYAINEMSESLSHLINMGYGSGTLSEHNLDVIQRVANGDNSANRTPLERSVNNLNFLLETHLMSVKQELENQNQNVKTFDAKPLQVSTLYANDYADEQPVFSVCVTTPHLLDEHGKHGNEKFSCFSKTSTIPQTDTEIIKEHLMKFIAHTQVQAIGALYQPNTELAKSYSTLLLPEEDEMLLDNNYLPSMIQQNLYFEAIHHVRNKMADLINDEEYTKTLYLKAYDLLGSPYNDLLLDEGKIKVVVQHYLNNNDDKPLNWDASKLILSFGEQSYDFKQKSLENETMIKEVALLHIPMAIEADLEKQLTIQSHPTM